VASTPEGLAALTESLLASDRVALEVTGSCWEVARILEAHVQRVIVVSPDDTGISSARAKTDKLDAQTLAGLLWKGELDAVWMPDERCQVLRRRLARREQLMRGRTRAKNEIQPTLQRRLVAEPPFADLFGVTGRRWLADLELPVKERARQALAAGDPTVTVSGVNLICAASFLAAIGAPSRFLDQPQTGRLPRSGPEDPAVPRDAGAVGSDLKARVGKRAVGAGQSGMECGQPARPVTRVS